jgi:hypothetical protein
MRSKNGVIAATLVPSDAELQHFPAASRVTSNIAINLLM